MNANVRLIVELGRSLIGIPYKYAVPPEEIGIYFDCSSFVQHIFRHINAELPRSTILQATKGAEVENLNAVQAGDLIFFRGTKGHYNDELFPDRPVYIGHVAVYTENNKALHAAQETGVIEEPIEKILEKREPIVIIKRLL